ncbi:MAG: hypothetical protein M0Q16_10350 [Candidatus Cloacimonetes bacterium]|nr:hypothetical protein [Candidatus Cloacimonadota bacterium]MCK9583541.1 hypothetical protein [Candidatus Cloacimonadota bacterium]
MDINTYIKNRAQELTKRHGFLKEEIVRVEAAYRELEQLAVKINEENGGNNGLERTD